MLGALKMRLGSLQVEPRIRKYVEPQVKDADIIAASAIDRLHHLVRDLTPHGMESIGLPGVLRQHLGKWTQNTELEVDFDEHLAGRRAPFKVETVAYRIAEEAVSNVVRHARAGRLRIELLQATEQLHLRIEDDGVGFDVDNARRGPASLRKTGLTLMEQRIAALGGRLEICSAPGRGTSVKASLPAFSAA